MRRNGGAVEYTTNEISSLSMANNGYLGMRVSLHTAITIVAVIMGRRFPRQRQVSRREEASQKSSARPSDRSTHVKRSTCRLPMY